MRSNCESFYEFVPSYARSDQSGGPFRTEARGRRSPISPPRASVLISPLETKAYSSKGFLSR